MIAEINYKPFDIEAAKNGAPVITRDGRPARIIKVSENTPVFRQVMNAFSDILCLQHKGIWLESPTHGAWECQACGLPNGG